MTIIRRILNWITDVVSRDEKIREELDDGGSVVIEQSGEVDVKPPSNSSYFARSSRRSSYSSKSEGELASRAVENHHVFSDVVDDPSLVGADSEVEAVAKVAVNNPGWASFVDFEADLGVDPGEVDAAAGDADAHAGESKHGCTGGSAPDYGDGASEDVATVSESGYTPSGPEAHSDLGSDGGGTDTGVSGGNSVAGDGGSGSSGGGGNSV
ncbi:hypothetical protein [Halovenus marina]|uniref:hypothetical protein n=1 Tax=Halovenus marina TaxID=3396621 RepID=UPI003F5553C8